MRQALILVVLVASCAAQTLVQSGSTSTSGANTVSISTGSNIASGNILLIASKTSSAGATAGSTVTITSSSGVPCIWTSLARIYDNQAGSSYTYNLSTCNVPSSGAETVQASWASNLGSTFADITYAEYSPAVGFTWAAPVLDVITQAQAPSASTVCSNTLTPVNKYDLVISDCENWDNAQTWGAATGFTNRASASTTSRGWYDANVGGAVAQSFSTTITSDLWTNVLVGLKMTPLTLSSGIIDPARSIDWTFAGIPGGIPDASWTQCGATLNPGASAATILGAWNHSGAGYTGCAAHTFIQLAAGTFNLATSIYCTTLGCNNSELRGMGASQTHLVYSSTGTCQGGNGSCGIGTDNPGNDDPPGQTGVNWTAGYAKGTTVITLANLSSITANSTMIVLDQCETGFSGVNCSGTAIDNNGFYEVGDKYTTTPTGGSVNGPDTGFARTHRFEWEIVQAVSCSPACGSNSAGTVTISIPLMHPDWASGQTPQAWFIQPNIGMGVRDLSMNLASTSATAGVSFKNCVRCFVQGVSVLHSFNIGIWFIQCLQCVAESNYIYDAGQNLANFDPTGIKHNGASNLYANNIIHKVRPFTLPEGPESGSVWIANCGFNSYTGDDFMFGGEWDGHSDGTDYNLLESNCTNQLTGDLIHGGHLMTTWYRNFSTGWESCANGQCGGFSSKGSDQSAVATQAYSRFANFVGNVLGTPGFTNTYQPANSGTYIFNNVVWAISRGNGGTSPSIPDDTVGQNSTMRWGNYDVVNAANRFNVGEVPSGFSPFPNSVPNLSCTSTLTCPPSFYYSARPSWWAITVPFPAIGPDVAGGNVGQCAGTPNTSGHYSGVAATSSANCVFTSLNTAWAGHVNAIPAMNCFLNVMNGPPDGKAATLTFDAGACYTSAAITNPLLIQGTVNISGSAVIR